MPKLIQELADSGKWLKVNTEINRAIALAKLARMIEYEIHIGEIEE